MGLMRVNPDAVGIKENDGNFNGAAVIILKNPTNFQLIFKIQVTEKDA